MKGRRILTVLGFCSVFTLLRRAFQRSPWGLVVLRSFLSLRPDGRLLLPSSSPGRADPAEVWKVCSVHLGGVSPGAHSTPFPAVSTRLFVAQRHSHGQAERFRQARLLRGPGGARSRPVRMPSVCTQVSLLVFRHTASPRLPPPAFLPLYSESDEALLPPLSSLSLKSSPALGARRPPGSGAAGGPLLE